MINKTKEELSKTFTQIYKDNFWRDEESVSGPGSNMEQTEAIRDCLPKLWHDYQIQSMLDIPCGDFYWMKKLAAWLPHKYIGADIVPEIIEKNQKWCDSGIEFQCLDVVTDRLPKVDLVMVRDLFGHLSNWNVHRAINNIRASGSTYLLATNFPDPKWEWCEIKDGQWRPVNLEKHFYLGQPITTINEGLLKADGFFSDKELALWKIND